MSKKYLIFIFLMSFPFLLSCSAPQKEMRAYIEPEPYWRMVEACGYESCGPKIDLLKRKDFTLRVEFGMGINNQFFGVLISFVSIKNKYELNPSSIVMKLKNEEMLQPKGFTCSNTIWDLHRLRNSPSIQGMISVKEGDCFLLFFDHPVSPIEEEMIMDLNRALTINGQSIGVPSIHFRKNIGTK